MNIWRILVVSAILAFLPLTFTIGKEPIIDPKKVDIDDPRVNISDFEETHPTNLDDKRKTLIASCTAQECDD